MALTCNVTLIECLLQSAATAAESESANQPEERQYSSQCKVLKRLKHFIVQHGVTSLYDHLTAIGNSGLLLYISSR